jgi:adenylate cyclase class 2
VAKSHSVMLRRRDTIREVEIKLRVQDVPALLSRLRRLGAKPRGRVLEQNTLYDTPDFDLRRDGRLLRLRVEAPAASRLFPAGKERRILTSKSPPSPGAGHSPRVSRYKERLEREAIIHGPHGWPDVILSIGLRPGFRYEKYRTSFRLRGLHLDLDETPIGTFLELEGPPRAINRIAKALGHSKRDYIRDTYWELYVKDCRRRGRVPRHMLFQEQESCKLHTLRLTNSRSPFN